MKHSIKLFARKLVLLGVFVFVVSAVAQSVPAASSHVAFIDSGPLPHDIWFWWFVIYYIFSAGAMAMPEPTQSSSDCYLWMYRWLHSLANAAPSFFQNKMFWPTSRPDPKAEGA